MFVVLVVLRHRTDDVFLAVNMILVKGRTIFSKKNKDVCHASACGFQCLPAEEGVCVAVLAAGKVRDWTDVCVFFSQLIKSITSTSAARPTDGVADTQLY